MFAFILHPQALLDNNYMKIIHNIYLAAILLSMGASLSLPAAAVENGTVEHFSTNNAGSYLSGQFARNKGDLDESVHYLQKVYNNDPSNVAIATQLQGMLLLQGNVEGAIALAEEISQADSKNPLSKLLLALHDIKDNKLDDADTLLNKGIETGQVQLWQPLLSAWLDSGRHLVTKPLKLEQFSAEVGRAAPLVYYHLALINAQAGFTDEAVDDFKKAIDPQNPPERVMKQLVRFYNAHNKPAALTPMVEAYLKANPASNTDDAAVIATAQDGAAEVLYTMGGIMLGAEVANDAVIYLQLSRYVKPDFAEASLALGDAYVALQQYERANDNYRRVPANSPFYNKTQLHIALNDDHRGKMDEALALLGDLAKKGSATEATAALITRGDLLRMHGRYNEAVADYSQAMTKMPELKTNYWPVLFARGTCYEQMGKWDLAEQDLRHALELKPDQPDVLNYLGYSLLEHGKDMAEAQKMLEKAVKAQPDNAQIVDSMGWALYLRGNYNDAAGYIEKAVELLPGDPTVNEHLGDVYWRIGRKTEARYQWERSLSFSPEAKQASGIERKLKEGLPPTAMADKAASAATP